MPPFVAALALLTVLVGQPFGGQDPSEDPPGAPGTAAPRAEPAPAAGGPAANPAPETSGEGEEPGAPAASGEPAEAADDDSGAPAAGGASEGKVDTAEWEALRKRVAQDRVKSQFLRREEASILHGLAQLDQALADARRRSSDTFDQIRRVEVKLRRLDDDLHRSEEEARRLRERAGKRAAAMQRLRGTRLSALFSDIRAPGELRRLRDRLRLVLAYDSGLIEKVRSAGQRIGELRGHLAAERATLESKQRALADEAEKAAMLREERSALLEGVRKERGASERLGSELLSAARSLEKELGVVRGLAPAPEAAPGGFEAQQHRLPWPVAGRVEVPFGKKVDPGSGMIMVQKGLDIRAPIATPVRAVFAGSVAYAAAFEGFGRLVILDHGAGFFTLYAHLEDVEVQKGQSVAAFQVIGSVGDSGSTKGAYLYFEIRQGKDALDPVRWLAP